MENKYKTLKISIFVLASMIIIIVILFIILNKQDIIENNEPYTKENEESYVDETIRNWEKVKMRDQYYTVEVLTERYLTYASDAIRSDSPTQEEDQKALYDIMDSKYLEEFKISNGKDLSEQLKHLVEKSKAFSIKNIFTIDKSINSKIFLVNIYLSHLQEEYNFFVKMDTINLTFSIFPQEYLEKHNYSEKDDNVEVGEERVEKKQYNSFQMEDISDERMCVDYFNQIKNKLLRSADTVQNMLDEEYYQKRFGSKEKLEAFLKNNQKELAKIEIKSYLVNYHTDYNEYVCKDQNDKVYVIKEYAVNDYKVQLDDYTLPDEELDKQYMTLTTQEKVVNNVNKWIKMLNYRDYESAFNVLDETFRTENFGNDASKFEQYMREKFPDHYKFDQVKYLEEAGISEQQITLSPISGGLESQIQETIYMQLGKDTNFVMSFNII